jgi:hypothetical protein
VNRVGNAAVEIDGAVLSFSTLKDNQPKSEAFANYICKAAFVSVSTSIMKVYF